MLKEVAGLTPLIGLAALCSVIYLLRFCWKPASWPKSATKTASVLLLAGASYIADGPIWLTVALALCALGDYLLSRDSEATFMAGIGAFAVGHIAYITLFLTHPAAQIDRLMMDACPWIIAPLVALALIMAKVLFSRAGDLRFAVLAYVPIIVGMGVASLALPALGPLTFAILGALLFVSSDFVLSLEMFVLRDSSSARKFTPFYVWASYWLAQFLIFFALGWAALN